MTKTEAEQLLKEWKEMFQEQFCREGGYFNDPSPDEVVEFTKNLIEAATIVERERAADIVEGYWWSNPPFDDKVMKEHNDDLLEARNRILNPQTK